MIDIDSITRYYSLMDPERIKSIRERHGLSKSGLARTLGTTYMVINYWETGKRRPSPAYARLLSQLELQEPGSVSED